DGIRDGHVTGVQTCALPIFVAGLDPLLEGTTFEGTSNVARVAVRAGDAAAEMLVSLRASAAGLDAELRVLSVGGRAVEAPGGGRSEERRGGKEWRARWSREW